MVGPLKDFMTRPDFNDLAQIHHGHAVGDVAYHRKIVGDEDQGQIEFLLQISHEVENLRLNRHIEC